MAPPPDRERRRASGSSGGGKPYKKAGFVAKKAGFAAKAAKKAGSGRGGGVAKKRTQQAAEGEPVAKKSSAAPRKDTPKKWGGLARKGTRWLDEPGAGPATTAWREAVARSRGQERPDAGSGDEDVEEIRIERVRQPARPTPPRQRAGKTTEAGGGGSRRPVRKSKAAQTDAEQTPTRRRPPRRLPGEVLNEVGRDVDPGRAARYADRLGEAARAYERDRYADALKILRPLVDRVPASVAVRELHGLTLYRLGRWREAAKELETLRTLTSSLDQHPTLADCYRALKRWSDVEALWEELREASPSAELVTEGRIVMAGSLADRGRLADAIDLLERAKAPAKNPRPHHLRLWYALGDLYERVGEIPRARELFGRVAAVDPELYDVAERLAGID